MKARLLLTTIALLTICGLTTAQSYQIRVTHNTNLRQSSSLDSAVMASAPAGSTLQVIGSFGRWFKISRGGGDVWMASWVDHTRVEGAASPAPAQNIDNCCFVDRQCNTPGEWDAGYFAFQNGQCQAPAQTGQATQPGGSAPASQMPAGVDNCCFVNRQCSSDAEWTDGYFAFQRGQCPVAGAQPGSAAGGGTRGYTGKIPRTRYMTEGVYQFLSNPPATDPFNNCCQMHHGTCHSREDWERGAQQFHSHQCHRPAPMGQRPAIVGPPTFQWLVNEALALMAKHAPEWLYYIDMSGAREFKLMPLGQWGGFYNQSWTIGHGWNEQERADPNWRGDMNYLAGYAGGITHEACHSIKQRTYTQTKGWRNEAPCVEAQLAVIKAVHPGSKDIGWLTNLVRDIENADWWS